MVVYRPRVRHPPGPKVSSRRETTMMVKNFGLFTASSDPLIQIKLLQFRVDCCVCGVVAEARGGEEGSTQARWLEARHRVVVDPLVVEIWNVLKNWRSVGEVLEGLWEIIRTLRNQSRVLGLAAFRLGTKGNRTDWVVWFGDGDERNSMWGGSRMYPTVDVIKERDAFKVFEE